jgi:isopropylmalate/homocitrate/citramalate synthase
MENQWCVSKINYFDEIVNGRVKVGKVEMADCTLRESEQQVDVNFTIDQKVQIALAMEEMGFQELEIGYPAVSEENRQAIEAIVKNLKKPTTRTRVVCRGVEKDIDFAAGAGLWGCSVSLGSGELTMKHRLKWSEERFIDTALKMTNYAKEKGLFVIMSPFDTVRADLKFLDKLLVAIAREGTVDRVRLVDSMGTVIPAAMKWLVTFMRERLKNIPVEVHCHNDFGLGTANTLAGLEAGASVVTSTVNGFGERIGNASTEEVLLALRVFYGIDLGIDLSQLTRLSRMVAEMADVPVWSNKPVTGKNAFRHESGMVVAGLITEPFSGEPYAPELVGQTREILIGKGSGGASIKWKLESMGYAPTKEQIDRTLEAVKEKSTQLGRVLADEDFAAILKTTLAAG